MFPVCLLTVISVLKLKHVGEFETLRRMLWSSSLHVWIVGLHRRSVLHEHWIGCTSNDLGSGVVCIEAPGIGHLRWCWANGGAAGERKTKHRAQQQDAGLPDKPLASFSDECVSGEFQHVWCMRIVGAAEFTAMSFLFVWSKHMLCIGFSANGKAPSHNNCRCLQSMYAAAGACDFLLWSV